tara:strand:- start:131 stop:1861 length:1731 start_codon:yes stop_codon:yes gene_type:complete
MSIYDKASLVLIPSGTKTSKVYSQKPVSGDGDFTFSRSTAATRVNSSGNIEKETQNLLLHSNSFDTTWVNSNSTETSGQSGYDGTNDAWQLTASSSGTAYLQQSNTQSGVQTFSVYAKAGTADHLQVYITNTDSSHYFDLTNGTASTPSGAGAIDSSIEDIGSGWYRCSCVCSGTNVQLRLYIRQGVSVNPSAGEYIYIQDAQLEQGLVARDVITTTTSAIYGGITDNVPRLDYTDSSCPALLLEPQRTNSATHSEYFGAWSAFRATITDNSATSPEGVSNAAVLTEDTTTNSHPLNKTFSVSSGAEYTLSIFAKQGSRRYLSLLAVNGGSTIYYDLQEKTAGSGGSVEDYGNGWLRLIYTYTTNSTSAELYIQPSINGSSVVYTGDGSNAVFLYGAQLEESTYATSYIPTFGSSVTRNGETCNSAGTSATFNDSEGVLFGEISALSNDQTNRRITISDGTNTNRVVFGYNTNSNQIFYFIIVGGSTIASGSYTTTDITDFHKVAIKYKVNDFALWVNGVERHTDSSGAIFAADTLSEMQFEQGAGGSLHFYGKTKQVIYIPTALTDAELQDLTTL